MAPGDTSADAVGVIRAVHEALGPEGRVVVAIEASELAFLISEDGIRHRHPAYDEAEVRWAALRARLGDPTFAAAFPGAPLLPS